MIDKTKMVKNYARLVNLQSLYEESLAKKPGNENVEQLLAQIKEVKEGWHEMIVLLDYYKEAIEERQNKLADRNETIYGLEQKIFMQDEVIQHQGKRLEEFERDYSGKV